LTSEEKKYINKHYELYFLKVMNGKRKNALADPKTQQEIFFFLLTESRLGRIMDPPNWQFSERTSYDEQKIVVLTPFEKLGVVIGHIGDKIDIEKGSG
jgi:hypothetical protein